MAKDEALVSAPLVPWIPLCSKVVSNRLEQLPFWYGTDRSSPHLWANWSRTAQLRLVKHSGAAVGSRAARPARTSCLILVSDHVGCWWASPHIVQSLFGDVSNVITHILRLLGRWCLFSLDEVFFLLVRQGGVGLRLDGHGWDQLTWVLQLAIYSGLVYSDIVHIDCLR